MTLTRKILISLGVWLLFAGIALVVGLKITDWSLYRTLSNGVGVYGTVTAKDAQNHQGVRYSYQVGPQTYNGVGHGGSGNPSFENLNVGDRVIVFYDASNPETSCLGYPQSHQRVEMGGIVFMIVFMPLWPVAITILILVISSKRKALYNNSLHRSAGQRGSQLTSSGDA